MTTLSIISITLFLLAGILFITAIVVFFMTDTIGAIRVLKNKETTENKTDSVSVYGITATPKLSEIKSENSQISVVNPIEYAQQTIDTDDLDSGPQDNFATVDWSLPEGISFVMTKNIMVFHSDKEYLRDEN